MIALILGGASCLWSDLNDLLATLGAPAGLIAPAGTMTVIATNAAGVYYPGDVHHWVTRHPENWVGLPQGKPGWLAQRRAKEPHRAEAVRWSNVMIDGVVDRYVEAWGGSSGLLAMAVAVDHLKADKIVLCGVPMDKRGHFDAGQEDVWKAAPTFQKDWTKVRHRMGDRVRSMSGWTREVHGAPTADWFFGEETERWNGLATRSGPAAGSPAS